MGQAKLMKATVILPRMETQKAISRLAELEWLHLLPSTSSSEHPNPYLDDLLLRAQKLFQDTDEVVRALFDADAVLNGILTRGPKPAKTKPDAGTNPDFTPYDVPGIAERTGGEVEKTKDAGGSLTRMVDRIRHRYNLQYHAPQGAPGFHKIDVRLSDTARARFPGALVRARSGYFAAR